MRIFVIALSCLLSHSAQAIQLSVPADQGGAVVVKNPVKPVFDDIRIELIEEAKYGGGEDDNPFRGIGALAIDHERTLYVADSQSRRVLVFDPSGKLIRTIGRQGEGPGEFPALTLIYFDSGGRLCCYGRNRLSIFDGEGRFLQSLNLRFGDVPISAAGAHWLVVRSTFRPGASDEEVILVDSTGAAVRTLMKSTRPRLQIQVGQAFLGFYNPFMPIFWIARLTGGGGAIGFSWENKIGLLDGSGQAFTLVESEEKPESYSREDKELVIGRESANNKVAVEEVRRLYEFPSHKAFFYGLMPGGTDRIFVQKTPRVEGRKQPWVFDVLDGGGRFLQRAIFPPAFEPALAIVDSDRVYAWSEDPISGEPAVIRYRIGNFRALKSSAR